MGGEDAGMQELPALLRRDGQGQHRVATGSATARTAPVARSGPSILGRSASRATRCSRNIAESTKAFRPHQRGQTDQEHILRME